MVYETFIVKDISELKDGEEQTLQIRDTDTYETRVVKAVISSDPKKLPGSDVLRIRWQRGQLVPEAWAIKITQELGGVAENLGLSP